MTRDELIRKICEVNLPDFVISKAAGGDILEIIENELALADIRPPWMPEPEIDDRWKPSGDLFEQACKMASNNLLSPEQRKALLALSGAQCMSPCAKCSRPGLKFRGDEVALCWYHREEVLGD